MRKIILFVILTVTISVTTEAQEQNDNYLQDLAKVVKALRKDNQSVRESAIATLSDKDKPKITLMDEIRIEDEDKNDKVKGAKGNRFKLNQIIAFVYKKQNHQLESKKIMLNGNEKDIHYSVIEKSVKRGTIVKYWLQGRIGEQEFIFIPYNPDTNYKVTMRIDNEEVINKLATGDCHIRLGKVRQWQTISFSIEYLEDKTNKDAVESFAILNYNPQIK